MSLLLNCSYCPWTGKGADRLQGKKVRCPDCMKVFRATGERVLSKENVEPVIDESSPDFTNENRMDDGGTDPDLDDIALIIEDAKAESAIRRKVGSGVEGKLVSGTDEHFASDGQVEVSSNFDRYEIIDEVARGAFGIVYRALDPKLGRDVAIKVLIAGKHASENEIKRFQLEAQAAAKLHHPNIVPIHEIGVFEDKHFFTLDFIEGADLRAIVKDKPRTGRVVKIMIDIAEAVQHAHDHGIIHRDLKPGNVLFDQSGRALVTDFGLARNVEADSSLTRSGDIVGTPAYMAPEQARGEIEEVDERSDVYSLGAVLYELLTGRAPFTGKGLMGLLLDVCEKEPESPRKYNPKIDRDLETICLKCLEKDKDRRYRTAAALKEDLERYGKGEVIAAKSTTISDFLVKWVKRNKALSGVAAVAALIILVGSTWFVWALNEKRVEAVNAMLARREDQKLAAPSLVSDAHSAIGKRNFEKAFKLASIAANFDPDLPDAWLLKAQLLIHKKDYVHALTALETYRELGDIDKNVGRLRELCEKTLAARTKGNAYDPSGEFSTVFSGKKSSSSRQN